MTLPKIVNYFFFLTIFTLMACKNEKSPVPYGPVDIQLDLNRPEFNAFIVTTHIFITGGGSGLGIVVYRMSQNEFKAYDRMCTSTSHGEWQRLAISQNSSILLECPECGSRFSLIDGAVNRGPAQFYLTEYQTFYNQALNTLWITN
jgi:nitrite reductase/ring-hydroxylating ferredoxin subunit